jgi:TPR repeat protein
MRSAWMFFGLVTMLSAQQSLAERAAAGDGESQVELGLRCRDGRGVPQDLVAAVRWFSLAAQQGNPRGQDNLGYMLLRGLGVDRDAEAAVGWFGKSAAQGCHWGLNNLASCLYRGEGVARDEARAIAIWQEAVQAGSRYACLDLAARFLPGSSESPEWQRARKWLVAGRKLGCPRCTSVLAYLLWHGIGCEADRERALDIWAEHDRDAHRYYSTYRERSGTAGTFANVSVDHLHQGYNLCGPTASAMAAAAWGRPIHPFDIKRDCRSPFGTGTDWAEMVDVLDYHGLTADLRTWPDTDEGFEDGMQVVQRELDAGRVVVVDVTWSGSTSGHTMLASGYDNEAGLLILHDPALPHPGIRLMPYSEWRSIWHSRWYSKQSRGVARPVIMRRGD